MYNYKSITILEGMLPIDISRTTVNPLRLHNNQAAYIKYFVIS